MTAKTVRLTDKLRNLTVDEANNIIGIDDHRIYGRVAGNCVTFPNPTQDGKRPTYQISYVDFIELKNGIVTLAVKSVKDASKWPTYTAIDDDPVTESADDPESMDELLPGAPAGLGAMADILDNIDAKLIGLRLGYGGLGSTPFYDDDGQDTYGYFTNNYARITFCNGTVYDAYSCDFDTVERVEKEDREAVIVSFTDGSTKTFNKYIESSDGIQLKPDYDGSYTSIEEMIRYIYTSDKLERCLYTSEIDHKVYFNWELLGMGFKGTMEYLAAAELTTICQTMEEHTKYEDKGRLKHPKINRDNVNHILVKFALNNNVNPFLELIKKAKPNDRFKIESFLRDVGVSSRLPNADENEEYVEKVSCALFLAIIERQMVNDNIRALRFVPILIGRQNTGKSLICKKLGLNDYHKESTESIDDVKKYIEGLDGGCVIAEIAEGTQFVQGKENAYKAWFGRNDYSFRKSYGRESMKFQKRFVEIITTNDSQILTDATGNTRYYPLFYDYDDATIPIQEHDDDMILSYYADAMERYNNGERWYHYVDTEDFQVIADKVRSGATRDIEGLPELTEYIKSFCPEAGSIITNAEIKEYLNGQPYDSKHIEKLFRLWGKVSTTHGFVKLPDGFKIKDGLSWIPTRGYQRIA